MPKFDVGADEIVNSADVIDSRDIEARIDYLETEIGNYLPHYFYNGEEVQLIESTDPDKYTIELPDGQRIEAETTSIVCRFYDADNIPTRCADADSIDQVSSAIPGCEFDELSEEREELNNLKALRDNVYSSEWLHGLTLIRESYWEEYVEDMVKDIGDLPREIPYYIEIDWEATAANVRADYSSVDFNGEPYLYRNY